MTQFKEFIEGKTQFYKEFEFESVKKAFGLIKDEVTPQKIIHIVGTNGKGSTGRALAYMLHKNAQSVLHYSSPHIKSFNERIWIDGSDIGDAILNDYHLKLLDLLDGMEKDLSYFEYSTLLALLISSQVEYLILEAGLGGEFDATNVIESDITILSTVGLDHQEILGETIEEITRTKVKVCDNILVVAEQNDAKVYQVCDRLVPQNIKIQCKDDFFIGGFLGKNIQTAIKVFEMLGLEWKLSLLDGFTMPARAQKISSNVMIDVGHNPLAASALLPLIEDATVLVYNAMRDKDIATVLTLLQPKLKRIEVLLLKNERVVDSKEIFHIANDLDLECKLYQGLDINDNYLVFGSFFTVEKFLELEGK